MPQFDFFNIFLTFFVFFSFFVVVETLTLYLVKSLVISKFYLITIDYISKRFNSILKH